jgi:hypothetical protein
MFCGECGTANPDTNQFCKNCGKPLRKPRQVQVPQPATVPVPPVATPQPVQPVYAQPPEGGGQVPGAAPLPSPVKQPSDKGTLALGVVGLLFGIVSWFRYPYVCALLAVILGGIVLYKSKNKTGKAAIAAMLAIVIGAACIIVDLFYFTIFPTPHLDL